MKIASIKLVNHGIRGAEINYAQIEKINKREFNNKNLKRNNAPVPLELRKAIERLKYHLLVITDRWQKDWDEFFLHSPDELCINPEYKATAKDLKGEYGQLRDVMDRLDVFMVEGGDDHFIIKGRYRILGTKKTMKIETPVITGDDSYAGHDEVIAMIQDDIFALTKDYVSGKLVADGTQFAMMFLEQEHTAEEVAELIDKMPKKEREKLMDDQLADMNLVAIDTPEDLGVEEDTPAEEPSEEPKEETLAEDSGSDESVEEPQNEEPATEEPKLEAVAEDEEEDLIPAEEAA